MQTPTSLLPPLDIGELAELGRRAVQVRLRHTWNSYPEIHDRITGLVAAGRFPGVRMTAKGAPTLNSNNDMLLELLMFEGLLASRVRNVIPQRAITAADTGADVYVSLDKRQSSAEIFAAMLTLQARSRAANHFPAFSLTLGEQKTLRYNLLDLPNLLAAMKETYAEAEETAKLEPSFQLVHSPEVVESAKNSTRVAPQGGYFKFYSNELDLIRYGIYRSRWEGEEYGLYQDSCIINTLRHQGVGGPELQEALSLVKTRDFPSRRLGEIAKVIKRDIELIYETKDATKNRQHRMKKNVYSAACKVFAEPIRIGLFNSHYFPYDKETKYSLFFANHYSELVEVCKNRNCKLSDVFKADTIVKGGAYTRNPSKLKLADSWRLIRGLMSSVGKENPALKPIPFEDAARVQFSDLHKDTFEAGEYELYDISDRKKDRLKIKFEDRKGHVEEKIRTINKKPAVYYADFEASTEEKQGKPLKKHIPYMIGWALHDEEKPVTHTAFNTDPELLVKTFLDALIAPLDYVEKNKRSVLVYFHNLRYDWSCLIEHVTVKSMLEKGGTLYEATIKHRGVQIVIRDSYKLVPAPLAKFPEMFGFETIKEAMPHKAFTREAVRRGLPKQKMDNITQLLNKAEDRLRFRKNVADLDLDDGRVDIKRYAEFYCARDVEVLALGLARFRKMVLDDFDMDTWTYRTISSIAYEYQVREGCFDGCYQLSGVANHFISRSVIGGQNQIAHNKPHATDEVCVDFDMTSCYPSGMETIKGYPTGLPKVMKKLLLEQLTPEAEFPFFVEIVIQDKHYEDPAVDHSFPFPPLFDKINGVMQYTNTPQQRLFVVNNIQLADLIRHYSWVKGEHFIIRRGFRFEGWNNRINTIIREVFLKRLAFKKADNPLQLIYKLILNSSYGKTITKPTTHSLRVFRRDEPAKIASFVRNNYSRISQSHQTAKQEIFTTYVPFSEHTSSPQAGSFILAQAKWLMRDVFLHAHAERVNIHYTDTDSMVLDLKDLPKLDRFVGKDTLGTFHTDLESGKFKKILGKDAYDSVKGNIYSARSVFVGKKTYHLRLALEHPETGETAHLRSGAGGCAPRGAIRPSPSWAGRELRPQGRRLPPLLQV
jgi:hypothetical protein